MDVGIKDRVQNVAHQSRLTYLRKEGREGRREKVCVCRVEE